MYYRKDDFIKNFANVARELAQLKEGCCHWLLETDNNGNEWSIVLGWQDGYEENKEDEASDGTWHLCAKVAYQPRNSIMQTDYDIDWVMPYDEDSGDVWDTDITVYLNDNHKETVGWLIKQYDLMKETLPCWN